MQCEQVAAGMYFLARYFCADATDLHKVSKSLDSWRQMRAPIGVIGVGASLVNRDRGHVHLLVYILNRRNKMGDLYAFDLTVASLAVLHTLAFAICFYKSTYDISQANPPMVTTDKCTVIIPCYLPNEHNIIVDTIERIMNEEAIERIIMVYNTPRSMLLEDTLSKMQTARFQSYHVVESTSRAENVMFALHECDIVTNTVLLLDADHWSSPGAIRMLLAEYEQRDESVVCIQGILTVRGNGCFARVLSGFAFLTGVYMQPAMRVLTGTALFTGGAAIWSTDALRRLKMRPLLSEDIDLTFRTVKEGFRIKETIYAQFSELEPASLLEFLRQRLRWTTGFEECRRMHWCHFLRKGSALFLIFVFMDASYALTLINIFHMTTTIALGHVPGVWIAIPLSCLGLLFFMMMALTLSVVNKTENMRRHAKSILFGLAIAPVYMVVQTFLFVFAYIRTPCPMRSHITRRNTRTIEKTSAMSACAVAMNET